MLPNVEQLFEIEPGSAAVDLEDFFEHGSVGLHLVDSRGVILRANRAELEMLGYEAGDYVGRNIAEFHADAEVIGDILTRLGSGERLDRYPARLRARDGSIRHVEISSSAHFRKGQFVNTRCFTVDVTALVEAERARADAERRLAVTYDNTMVGIGEADAQGRFLNVNTAFCELTGYSREELQGKTFADITHPDDRGRDLDLYAAQVAGQGGGYAIEKRYVRKDGTEIDVEVLSSTVKGADGAFHYGVRVANDISERKRAEQMLQDSERRSRELLDALPMAVYTTDADGVITYFNETGAAFAGRQPVVGVDRWCVTWKLYDMDGAPLPHDQCPMALALRTQEELRGVEAVAERPDGTRRIFTPYPTLLRDASGRITGAVNVLVDITDRKQADEQQRVLIDELNHRVKNTLATVQSISMHTHRSTPDQFVDRFEGRLDALSKAHDLLTRRRWTGVGLREILEQELAAYMDVAVERITLDGAELTLSAREGLAVAMVIHELATNAAKYGALSKDTGQVKVSWRVAANEPRRLILEWAEHRGPEVQPPSRRGFGRRLIERTIGKDLSGTLDMDFDPSGLRCRLEFPRQSRMRRD